MLQPNTTFDNHYTLIRQLGRGGFSEVWLAHDSYMDLDVVIKIYAPGQGMDASSINEFRREITGVFHLNHPNLLRPQHLGIYENMPYLIMMYCAAGSCTNRIGKMSEQELWKLIHDVAAGLACLHEHDVVHQDIKPDNILQDDAGNYLITDFGISTRARSTLRKSVMSSTNSAGTLAYMGPERFSTQPAPTKASDIWSLGAMLYELLEGVTPFPPDFGGSMLNVGAAIPTINAPISENLKQTIYKMLSKETWDRPTAATLVEWTKNPSAIEKPSLPTQRKITKPAEQPQQPKQPKSRGWIWIIVALLLVAGLGTVSIRKYQEHQLEIAINEQIRYYNSIREAQRQDSIRQVQIQDSIREVRRQDSIRIEQERIRRQDSIIAAQAAEQERQLRLQKEKEERQRKENERKRREQICIDSIAKEAERKHIAEEKRIQSLQGFHNGHEYVDLGLSVKWAICNVGADYPEDYGNYFAWGEVTTKHNYDWSTYKYCYRNHQQLTKYNFLSEFGSVDNKRILESSDDAATINWGGNWRMPTKKEFDELRKFCSWKWTKINGINGYLITSNKENYEGVSIFLPAAGCRREYSHYYENDAGCYNSSTLGDGDTRHVYELYFYSSSISCKSGYVRYCGQTVRAVCK
jgi:serine/threonine protein kinase